MRKRITPATVLAMIALFVALAGSATAAGTVLITGKQIKNGTVGLVDLSASAKRALKGARGPAGPQGIPGPAGVAGAAGLPGGFDPAKLSYVTGTTFTLAPDTGNFSTTYCPAGARAVSGGWLVITGGIGEVFSNSASVDGSGWTIHVWNHSDFTNATITPYAVCASK
jgi:hypothetical protein